METNNTEQKRWEIIDSYLRGELTEPEKDEFDRQIAENPLLAEELEKIRTASSVVRKYAQREELKAIHQKMVSRRRSESLNPNHGIGFYMKIAAIIVFLVAAWAGIGFATLSPATLYMEEVVSYIPETTRDESDPRKAAVEYEMQTEYVKSNYTRVVELYQKSTTRNIRESFLAGNAYLATNQSFQAITCFQRVMALSSRENTFDYYQEAEYYLAWAYLKNNQLKEANQLFDKIYQSEYHIHNSDVDSWFYWKLKLLQWKRGR